MLAGLSTGNESAQHCFILLQNNSHFYDSYGTKISWNHIFYAFERYFETFKTDQYQNQLNMHQHTFNYNQMRSNPSMGNKGITQAELQGLISVIRLVNQIALNSEKARIALYEFHRSDSANPANITSYGLNNLAETSNSYTLPVIMFGLIGCSIPITLKGKQNFCLSVTQKQKYNISKQFLILHNFNYIFGLQALLISNIFLVTNQMNLSEKMEVFLYNKRWIIVQISESYFWREFCTLSFKIINNFF